MENKSAFARNLNKARTLAGMTQDQAAGAIGIKRGAYGAYEEDRAFPPRLVLSAIAETFHLENNLYEFITNPDFYDVKGRKTNLRKLSTLEQKYHGAKPEIRRAVNVLLNVSQNI